MSRIEAEAQTLVDLQKTLRTSVIFKEPPEEAILPDLESVIERQKSLKRSIHELYWAWKDDYEGFIEASEEWAECVELGNDEYRNGLLRQSELLSELLSAWDLRVRKVSGHIELASEEGSKLLRIFETEKRSQRYPRALELCYQIYSNYNRICFRLAFVEALMTQDKAIGFIVEEGKKYKEKQRMMRERRRWARRWEGDDQNDH